ncbi:MAG: secretin N-terminal domain-containing protein, partial [Gammaproteobacteria bacterium]
TIDESFVSGGGGSSSGEGGDANSSDSGTTEITVNGQPGRIAVDERTNSVIVRGTPQVVADVEAIVKRLDRQVPLVDIEVMIVQADAGLSRSLGVQWAYGRGFSANGRKNFGVSTGPTAGQTVLDLSQEASQTAASRTSTTVGSGGSTTTNTTSSVDPITLLPLATFDSIVGSFIYNGSRAFIQAQINALAEQDKAEIISSPHVVTLNNVPAKITSTDKLHVPLQGKEGGEAEIEQIDAGLSLDITPSVFEDDLAGAEQLIRMNINARNSSFTSQFQTTEKEIQTQVILRNGGTFVLGGLFETRRAEGEDGVPGLKDIPLLGALFRSRSSVDSRAESVFFITPTVVNQEDLIAADVGNRKFFRENRARLGKSAQDFMLRQNNRLSRDTEDLHRESYLIDLTAGLEEDE